MLELKNKFIVACISIYGCYVEDREKFLTCTDKLEIDDFEYSLLLEFATKAERLCKFSLLNILRLFLYKTFNRKPSFLLQ